MFDKKIIYWKYAMWIGIYSIIFVTLGVTIGKLLDNSLPKHDETKTKSKLLLEIYIQIALVGVATYIMREYTEHIMKSMFKIEKSPDKFAVLIIAPTLFSQMKNLANKITHVWKM